MTPDEQYQHIASSNDKFGDATEMAREAEGTALQINWYFE